MRPRISIRGCVCPSVRPSVRPSVSQQLAKIDENHQTSLLDASSHLYKRLCLSVHPSVHPSVGQQLAKIDENHQASLLVGPVENAKQISEPKTMDVFFSFICDYFYFLMEMTLNGFNLWFFQYLSTR